MGFFDNAQDVLEKGANVAQGALDKGVSAAKGVVSGVAVEQQAFMKDFVRLLADGWAQGWHEANGGNLTYRLADGEASSCRPFFYDNPSSWVNMGVRAENLAGAYFAVTAAGCHMRTAPLDPSRSVGIVEIDGEGGAWRIVWGLREGGVPTSEFPSHFMAHAKRMEATDGASRVVYHAHPQNIAALTLVLPLESRAFSRALWKAMTECIMLFPQGVGVVPWMVPGSDGLAQATSDLMATYDAVVWAHHGMVCAGRDFDAAFGLMHAIEKAAGIYAQARAMNGGSDAFCNVIGDDALRAIADSLNLTANEGFLA